MQLQVRDISNVEIIQIYQTQLLLRKIMGEPWYVGNQVFHKDLEIP